MELDPQELIDGRRWFFGAGFLAVCFCFFLLWVDFFLSNSDREQILGQTLYELRSAQSAVGNGSNVDARIVTGQHGHRASAPQSDAHHQEVEHAPEHSDAQAAGHE